MGRKTHRSAEDDAVVPADDSTVVPVGDDAVTPVPKRVITVDFTDTPRFKPYRKSKVSERHQSGTLKDGRAIYKTVTKGGADGLQIIKFGTTEMDTPDMREDILEGRLGEICQKRMKEYPIAYAWPTLVTTAAALIDPGDCPIRSNLFTALVGGMGSGKSSCIERAFYLLRAESSGAVAKIKAGSAEGLLAAIGERQAPVLLAPDELAHLLAKSQIENASFPMILNSLFYEDEQHLLVARGKQVTFEARLSLLAGIVEDRFEDAFGASSITGLFDRFLFGLMPSTHKDLEYRPPQASGEPVFNPAKTRLRMPKIHRAVWEERDKWVIECKMPSRVVEIALRVAAICAAFDGRDQLTVRDLRPSAYELAGYQYQVRQMLRPNEGQNQEAKAANSILQYLDRKVGKDIWITRRDLFRKSHIDRRYGDNMIDRVLRALAGAHRIEFEENKQQNGAGRPSSRVRLLESFDDEE